MMPVMLGDGGRIRIEFILPQESRDQAWTTCYRSKRARNETDFIIQKYIIICTEYISCQKCQDLSL